MKILIAPDKFKGSLSASAAAAAMERGFARGWGGAVNAILCPIADGGEGTARALCDAMAGEWVEKSVRGPLGRPVRAGYAWIPGPEPLAVIEMSEASGLALVPPEERRALEATTYGTGELLRDAVARGATRVIVGLGGSATTDGGLGLAEALGFIFLDAEGRAVEGVTPASFGSVASIRRGAVSLPEIVIASDVQNPLLGERGSAHLFSRQKGATEEEVHLLEAIMERLAQMVARDLGLVGDGQHHEVPGAGAAGGLGFGLLAFTGAKMRPGFELVAEVLRLEAHVAGADLVLTGEGSLDEQTLEGKGPAGVAALARRYGKPVIAFGGRVVRDPRVRAVFDVAMPLADAPMPLEEALKEAEQLLEAAAERLGAALRIGGRLPA